MNTNLFKNLTLFIGGILFLATGFMYVLITDLYLGNTSTYLLSGIVLVCGGGILFLLADNFKNKKVRFFVLKAVGIVLSILFVLFAFAFTKNEIFNKVAYLKLFRKVVDTGKIVSFFSRLKFQKGLKLVLNIKPLYYVNIALSIVSIIIQGINIAIYAKYGVEE